MRIIVVIFAALALLTGCNPTRLRGPTLYDMEYFKSASTVYQMMQHEIQP